MGRQLNRLSAKALTAFKQAGLYCDGGGLYLQVTPAGGKTWIFRYRSPITSKLRDMGLGPLHVVGLSNEAEAAYRRGDLMEKRRRLMEAWAEFINTPYADNAVIPLKAAA